MWKKYKQKVLVDYWNPFWAVLLIAVLSAYYFGFLHTYWAITGELTRWGGSIVRLFGVEVSEWKYFQIIGLQGGVLNRVDGVMLVGMFLGALGASLLASKFTWVFPHHKIRIFQALIGGVIAGFGARLGMGCNLASFFTGIPQFSLHAWIFTITSLLGVFIGIKVIQMPFFQPKIQLQKGAFHSTSPKQRNTWLLGVLVSLGALLFGLYFFSIGASKLGVACLFGIAFGFIIARAQVCFTSAFRDLFLFGRSSMAKAIIYGMMLSTLGVLAFVMLGVAPKISWVGLNVVIGGVLFGFGIVIAGGCECGWIYRSMRGQGVFLVVGVGNIIGSILLAYVWEFCGESLATSFPKVNFLEVFGNYGGLAFNYALMIALLGLILWIEMRCKPKEYSCKGGNDEKN